MRLTELITLSPEDFDKFLAALEEPPAPNEALKELLRRPPPWVEAACDDWKY